MNGDLKQRQREAVIKQLKQRRLRIVVATDVAARGLDIKDLSHVVNYDMPSKDAYIHRIGRAGRAGAKGTSMLMSLTKKKES